MKRVKQARVQAVHVPLRPPEYFVQRHQIVLLDWYAVLQTDVRLRLLHCIDLRASIPMIAEPRLQVTYVTDKNNVFRQVNVV